MPDLIAVEADTEAEAANRLRLLQCREDRTDDDRSHDSYNNGAGDSATTPALRAPKEAAVRSLRHRKTPSDAGLYLQTNIPNQVAGSSLGKSILQNKLSSGPIITETPVQTIYTSLSPGATLPTMTSSLRSTLSTNSLSSALSPTPSSALPSPYLAAMSDITPLPSPLVASDPAVPWRKYVASGHGSIDETASIAQAQATSPESPQRKKKTYGSLALEAMAANNAAFNQNQDTGTHGRHRSISDFVPETLQNVRQRHVTFGPGDGTVPSESQMHREAYVAAQRGLTTAPLVNPIKTLPSPPPSNSSVAESEDAEAEAEVEEEEQEDDNVEYLAIHCGINNRKRKFRQIRQLGQGTFSKVMLATNQRLPPDRTPDESQLDPHELVAVKIIEHGPAGGADEERIETSLKREVEMLKSISHPSLVHLRACEYQPTRTLLVLSYCPGGDLFDIATANRDILTPPLVQRIFAELVAATRYLHDNWIVHRDIKLENVLVNLPAARLATIATPQTHPTPLATLTDLGLGRRIPPPPESPLLTTRCGSEDYAAPEILLGQPYDGRATDAWALGVLLYALMEGRLPFDAPPGKPDRSRNTHRIARCDWIWCRFGDEDGEWDPVRGGAWEGARVVVEALLKKVRMGRMSLVEVQGLEWVRDGVKVEGGLGGRDLDCEGGADVEMS